MAASSVFITNHKGKPLIHRNYRGSVSKTVITEEFARILIENDNDINCSSPIIIDKEITFCFVPYNDLYLLIVTKSNSNIMLMLNFLYKIISVFEDYFDGLDEEVIRDNFVLIYELFDEMCDFGYPQHTESMLLKDYILIKDGIKRDKKPENESLEHTKNALATITGQNIRSKSIKYKKNEVFLDVIEKVNLSLNNNGNILNSEIIGTIKLKSYLSGIPQLKLGLNDKLLIQRRTRSRTRNKRRTKTVEFNDIKFHECVRLNRFEQDRAITFIPPDGECELMKYRLDTNIKPLITVECIKNIKSHSRIEYLVKIRSEFKQRSTANNVEILIPIPSDADSPSFKPSIGSVQYIPEQNIMKWTLKQLNGGKEYLMRAHFGLPSIDNNDLDKKEPIRIAFEIPYFTVSGIQVRYLKIIEKSGYKALPWVRYITQNGDYSIRM